MIDLHCHFLPGVDDGAQTLDEALALARAAVADGIRVAVLTPHVHPGRYANCRRSLLPHFQAFRAALADAGIALEIRLGGEVRLGVEALELLLDDDIPFLGTLDGGRAMLLELPHQTLPVGCAQFVEKLLALGVRPLLAHPERNKAIMAQPERLVPLLDAGCRLQVTAGSLCGCFGEGAKSTAVKLLENGWVHVLATDAHNLSHRPPALADGRRAAAAIVGDALAWEMVSGRPQRMLEAG